MYMDKSEVELKYKTRYIEIKGLLIFGNEMILKFQKNRNHFLGTYVPRK